jgi:hypothetical protein
MGGGNERALGSCHGNVVEIAVEEERAGDADWDADVPEEVTEKMAATQIAVWVKLIVCRSK